MITLYKKTYKNLLIVLLISIFITVSLAYMLYNVLDMFNPIFTDKEIILLSPQMEGLLGELEKKFK